LDENTLISELHRVSGDLTVNKQRILWMCSVLLLVCAKPVLAQTGCLDSPENPTVILGVAGAAGAFFSTVRYRAKARRKTSR
jgi:XrtJ-associated TM-motif-TM protein